MKQYRIATKDFSRLWRRGKSYTFPELRWLARRRGLDIRRHKKRIQLSGPSGVVVTFDELPEPMTASPRSERLMALAALQLPSPRI